MHRYRLLAVLGFLLTFSTVVFGSSAPAPTPAFTITASNVTMSSNGSSGVGSSSFTLTSVNGYTGTVGLNCSPPTPPTGVIVPYCDWSSGAIARPPYALTANQVLTGSIPFINAIPPCNPCPVSLPRRGGHGLAPGLALAGALLFGFGIRRRAARWLMLTLLAAGALAGLAGIGACGGNNNVVTPGTYTYTITAMDMNTFASVNTSVNVTVP
jgi:hypothetical protein